MRSYLLFLIILFGYLTNSQAQIVTDRPDQTESSSTVPHQSLQIESGVLVGYQGNESSSVRQLLLPTTLFRYGLTKGIELRFLSQVESQKTGLNTSEGISDIELGTKIQLFQRDGVNTEIAFLSHLILPLGTSDLSLEEYGTINKLSISHRITDRVGLGYNIGYNYFGEGSGDLTYSVALGVSVNSKVGVYIEPYGDFANFEDWISSFDAGFTYLANENLQFDFSFGTGLNHEMNYTSLGVSWLLLSDSK